MLISRTAGAYNQDSGDGKTRAYSSSALNRKETINCFLIFRLLRITA